MQIIQDFIAKGRINRPGTINSCKFITIHETANTKRGADAKAHAAYIKTLKEKTSWHYTVDDKSIYQHLPDSEKSYHTSKAEANESSIAIEICVNEDGNYTDAVTNAVWLVRKLMKEYGIGASNIKTHRDWTGKDCPKALVGELWNDFIRRCSASEEEKLITIEELRKMGYTGIKF